MYLMGMRFREFTWRDNPVSLQVSASRNVVETQVPYGRSRAEELGSQRRKITGEGYFSGKDCMTSWEGLQQAFSQKGPGLLQLPGLTPFWAVMDGLSLIGAQGKDLVRYTFSFTEWKSQQPFPGTGVYEAQAGESLWEYAWKWGRSVEELVKANPQIRDIDDLQQGEKVVIP